QQPGRCTIQYYSFHRLFLYQFASLGDSFLLLFNSLNGIGRYSLPGLQLSKSLSLSFSAANLSASYNQPQRIISWIRCPSIANSNIRSCAIWSRIPLLLSPGFVTAKSGSLARSRTCCIKG